MAGVKDLNSIWNNVREIDLRPAREDAEEPVRLAIVSRLGRDECHLADQMRRDPIHPAVTVNTPLPVLDFEAAEPAINADLMIVLADLGSVPSAAEESLLRGWSEAGCKILVVINTPIPEVAKLAESAPENQQLLAHPRFNWPGLQVVSGSIHNERFMIDEFAPAVIRLLPEQLLSLGRHYPLFRTAIARQLINDACFSNAAYALSTGLAEIVPVFDIPLNVADMVVLTKSQAFLIYKLGLTLGLSTRWQDYVTEFSGVLGGGFLWRQVARQMVGLIPAWGIIPKMAVSYAGTYVVGHVVLQWYLTGKHVSKHQMRQLYRQAFARGKQLAKSMAGKLPRPKFRRSKRDKKLALSPPNEVQVCPQCGRESAADANYCQYCRQILASSPDKPVGV